MRHFVKQFLPVFILAAPTVLQAKESLYQGIKLDQDLQRDYDNLVETKNQIAAMSVKEVAAKVEDFLHNVPSELQNDERFLKVAASMRSSAANLTEEAKAEKVNELEAKLEEKESLDALAFAFTRWAWSDTYDNNDRFCAFLLTVVLLPLDCVFLPFTFINDVTEAGLGSVVRPRAELSPNYMMIFTRANGGDPSLSPTDRAWRAAKTPMSLVFDLALSPIEFLVTVYDRIG